MAGYLQAELTAVLDRTWARIRSLFVPSVAVVSVLAACEHAGPADQAAAVLQLYTWERERLFTLAKGMAAAAVTVLTGLIADAVENKTSATSAVVIYSAAALVGLLLLWGAFILTGLRRLAEEYALALRIIGQ